MPIKWEDLAAGGAGAVDELLFGIPEFVAKKIDRKKVEDWIKANEPAYRTGEMVGTVGSMFLPVPGLGAVKGAKGAVTAARALKGVDTAADIAKAAKGLTLGQMAARGALSGAAEAGVRGITSEKSLQDIAKDIQSGALFGAGGGVAGGLISKGLGKFGKRAEDLAGEARKMSDKAVIGLTPLKGRDTQRLLKDVAGPGAKGLGKFAKRDFTREALADIIRDEKLYLAGADDKYFAKVMKDWDNIGKAFETAYPDVRGSGVLAEAIKRGSDDIKKVMQMPGGKDAVDRLAKYMSDAKDIQGLNPVKTYLSNVVKDTFNPARATDANAAEAERALANILKRNVDDMSIDAAEKLGLDIDFAKRRKNYVFDRQIADAIAREDVAPLRVNTGSPTMEKLGMGLAGATLGGVSGAAGGEDVPIGERIGKAAKQAALFGAAGLAGSSLKSLSSKAASTAIAKSKPLAELAEKVAPSVAKFAEKLTPEAGAVVGGQAASIISRQAKAEAAPETPAQEKAADTGAAAGAGEPRYVSQVMDRMRAYAAARGVPEDSAEFQQFAQAVYAATEGFAPDKIGGILYPDPEERKAYTRALMAARRLSEIGPQAIAARPGLLVPETPEQKIARESAVDQLASLVGDVAKERGSEKAAKAALTKILGGRESPERKAELVRLLLAQYGVDLDALTEMGVV